MKKRMLALMLAGAMVVSLAACGSTTSTSTSTDSTTSEAATTEAATTEAAGTEAAAAETGEVPVHEATYGTETAHSATKKHESINIAMDVEPGDLSPEATADSGGNMWKWQVYERLFDIDGFGGDLVGRIAESYEKVDDTTYKITLHQGVLDSDGNEIHSSDVKYSYDTLKAAGNRMSGDIAKYEDVEIIDDYTFNMIMNQPLDGLSDLTTILGQAFIVSEQAAKDHNLTTDPCGTGPYKVTDYQSGSSITMEARDDYWAEGQDFQTIRMCANVQTITYKVVAEAAQNAIGLETGELDFSGYVSSTDIVNFTDGDYKDSFHTVKYLDNLTLGLFANCDDNHSDLNLRLAIFYALDGEQLADASGSNDYVVAHTLGNAKYPEYQDAWTTEENYYNVQDLELAQDYLSKSNYNGEELTLICNNEAALSNVAVAIQAMLLNIGINVKIDAEDGTITEQNQVDGNYDLMLTKMASDNFLPVVWTRWFDSDYHTVTTTICGATDPKIQEMLDVVTVVGGNTDENVNEFHEYMVENAYGYGLYSDCKSDVITNDITTECWNFQDYIIPGGCIYSDNEF